MDCDALFASDDEIEVLPSSSEAMPTSDESQTSKSAISSNCVNSTTPTQPYEVNLEPLTHPASSHTPVPEEYQPLPDSSTTNSIEHLISGNATDCTDANGQRRFPDMNIRYQPKPVMNHQRGYYYPNYAHYAGGVRPPRQYFVTPYHTNNVIVLNDDRNYLSHPVSYGLPANPANPQTPAHRGYERLHADSNAYGRLPANYTDNLDDGQVHINPERPSRKLNISPRRRQSKENETSSNLIVVSSEEEDNVPGLRNRQFESSQLAPDNIPTNGARQPASPSPRIDIKREPHDQVEVATQAAGDADANRSTEQPQPHQQVWDGTHCHTHSHLPPHAEHNHCVQNAPILRIKQEHSGCANSRNHNYADKVNQAHGGRLHSKSDQSSGASQSPRANSQNGSHNHHHYHRNVRQCANNGENAPGGSNPSTSQVKEEPGTHPMNIKQEVNVQQAQCSQDARTPTSVNAIKVETVEQPQVKAEPLSPSPSIIIPTRVSAYMKAEPGDDSKGRNDMDAAGDRKPMETSPEPGTSGRPLQPPNAPSSNCSQVIKFSILFP